MSYKYEKIAQKLIEAVEKGAFIPGDKLPSLRTISRDYGVSISTALKSYEYLEYRGLLDIREKTGHFLLPHNEIKQEITTTLKRPKIFKNNDLISRLLAHANDPDYVSFAVAVPDKKYLHSLNAEKIACRILNKNTGCFSHYQLPNGYLPLREALAKRMINHAGEISSEEILVTVGATEALQLALRALFRPNDLIAVESPSYMGFWKLLQQLQLNILEVPADAVNGLDIDLFEKATSKYPIKGLITVPNFNNPTGAWMPEENRQRLVRFCNKKNIPIIEDDVYGDFYYGLNRRRSLYFYDQKGIVIYLSSFSKTMGPGHRLGWIAPGKFMEQIIQMKITSSLSSSSFSQLLVTEILEKGIYDKYLRNLRKKISRNMYGLYQDVKSIWGKHINIYYPQGGFFLWVELPPTCDTDQLLKKVFSNKILFIPGRLFDISGQFKNFIRLSAGKDIGPQARQAAFRKIAKFLRS